MKKWGVFHTPSQTYIEFFEYPQQAHNYILKKHNNSPAYKILRLNK